MRISDWSSDVCSSDLQDKSGRKPRIGEVEHENERIAERLHPRPAHKANELERARGDQQSGRDGVGGTRNPRRERQRGGRDHRHVEAVRQSWKRSEERRVGKGWVSTGRYRW